MKSAKLIPCLWLTLVVAICLAVAVGSHAQQSRTFTAQPNAARTQTNPTSAAAMSAEKEQIWNSPNMLRARAWLQDYCSKSAKVTPELAQHYMTELQNMTPSQMELWLLKFDDEEQRRQSQYSLWQQAHAAGLSRAVAANQQTQQAYSAINRGENQAAGEEEQQVNQQQQDAENAQENKQLETVGPYAPYGYGGVHYHFHLYPYPY